jgi:hypothetical protein
MRSLKKIQLAAATAAATTLAGCAGGLGVDADTTVSREAFVRAGQPFELGSYRTSRRSSGCRTVSLPTIEFIQPASHGQTFVTQGLRQVGPESDGCVGRFSVRVPGYRPDRDFHGVDELSYLVTFSDGERYAVRYRLNVR